jgi:hypothetical protein
MMPPQEVRLSVYLTESQARALAQFVKRVTWTEMRSCAVDNQEAELIRDALDHVRTGLADEGYAPR